MEGPLTLGRGSEPRRNLQSRRVENEEIRQVVGYSTGLSWGYVELTYSFPNLEPVCCSMSGCNCCFLTCIPVSQEAGKVVWYFYLLKSFPHFVVIHMVKGFGIVNKAEVDVFLELSCFFDDPMNVGNLISGSVLGMNFSCSFLVFHMDFLCVSSPFVEDHNWVEI